MIYAIPLFYRLSSVDSHISITRLHRALQSIVMKHSILRTALHFDSNSTIMKQVNTISDSDDMKLYGFSIINIENDDDRGIDKIIDEILNHCQLFDLIKGHVIHCHILRHDRLSVLNGDDLLMTDDMILLHIYHSAFDGASTSMFLPDFSLAYESNCSLLMDDNAMQYVDYSIHEHQMDMTRSRDFWHSQLEEYNLECRLPLSADRQRLSTDQRSGWSSMAQISFNNDISTSFLNYASSYHLTLFQLGLASFYALLFKLTHGQNDVCTACINTNRYRSELQNMIGMFVSTLPYRLEVGPNWSSDNLVKHARDNCLSILEHSHYPLQHIIADFHLNQSNVPFLETVFDFITVSSDIYDLSFNGTKLKEMSLLQSSEIVRFDFTLTFIYNQSVDDGRLSCHFACSRDLFDEATVNKIAQRFQYHFTQIFSSNSSTGQLDSCLTPVSKFNIILPEEVEEMQKIQSFVD